MRLLITRPNHDYLVDIDGFSGTGVLLLLLEGEEISRSEHKPPSIIIYGLLPPCFQQPGLFVEVSLVNDGIDFRQKIFFIQGHFIIIQTYNYKQFMGNQVCCQQNLQNKDEYSYYKFNKPTQANLLNSKNQEKAHQSAASKDNHQHHKESNIGANRSTSKVYEGSSLDESIISLQPYRQKYKKTDSFKQKGNEKLSIKLNGTSPDQKHHDKIGKKDKHSFKIRAEQSTESQRLNERNSLSYDEKEQISSITVNSNPNNKINGSLQFLGQDSFLKEQNDILSENFQDYKEALTDISVKELPQLTKEAIQTANSLDLFSLNFKDLKYIKYGKQFYHCKYDEQMKVPHGFGRFFKQNGSVYVGNLVLGRANGEGIYVFPDGSYYKGIFKFNKANGHGLYKSAKLMYVGQFKENFFDGSGSQTGITHYFKGTYRKNKKIEGCLRWRIHKQQFQYDGKFNQNQLFEGKGTLLQTKGKYIGQFTNGVKHGKAEYVFKRGLKYEGQYIFGQRQGQGTLYNLLENGEYKLAYRGEFRKGLPDGKGQVPISGGKFIQTTWIEGVDSQTMI